MTYQKEASVICLDDAKQAALYFERVIPISCMTKRVLPSFTKGHVFNNYEEYLSVITNLIEPGRVVDYEIIKSMHSNLEVLVQATIVSLCEHCQHGARNVSQEQLKEFIASLPPPQETTEEEVKKLAEKIVFTPRIRTMTYFLLRRLRHLKILIFFF